MKYTGPISQWKGWRITVLIGIGVGCTLTSLQSVHAQDLPHQDLFEHIAELAKTTGGYHAEYVHVDTTGKTRKVIKGRLKKKWPNMRWGEIHKGHDDRPIGFSISNGTTSWLYWSKFRMAMKRSVQEREWIDEESLRYVRTEFFAGEEVYVIEAQQRSEILDDPHHSPVRVELYLGTQDGIVRQMIEYDPQGQITGTQIYFNIRPDPAIIDKDFEFVPPSGTQIIEWNDSGEETQVEL